MDDSVSIMTAIATYAGVGQNVIVSLCAVCTVVIAAAGLTSWRRQLKGAAQYSLAKDILASVYQVHRTFARARARLSFSEYPHEFLWPDACQLTRDQSLYAIEHAYRCRQEALSEDFAELRSKMAVAEVEWGTEIGDLFDELDACRRSYDAGVLLMLIHRDFPPEPHPMNQLPPVMKPLEESTFVYSGDPDCDWFGQQIEQAVRAIEQRLRRHVH